MTAPADRQLLRLIDAIRASHPDVEQLYLAGQCYAFFLIVRSLRPAAEAWYSQVEGHVYSLVSGRLYDIRGLCRRPPADIARLDHKHGDRPHRWGRRDGRRLN